MKKPKLTRKQKDLRSSWEQVLAKYPPGKSSPKREYHPVLPMRMAELPPRTTVEEFDHRMQLIADGRTLTPRQQSVHRPEDHCLMPMHKGGYQPVTDPQLIPLMGKKP